MPEVFDPAVVRERYLSTASGTPRVEAWRLALEGLLADLGPSRGLDRDQLAQVRAGTDSVAALLDSVLWSSPLLGTDWEPSEPELSARADALARMDDESSIFTRYYGDFEGKRVENHCPGAQVARQLFAQGWGMVAERLEERATRKEERTEGQGRNRGLL
ncbi:MAG: hypothetical protein IPH65_04735 [Dehalococcoidia bacterium]|uniref:hypothetical protein n=1 Tax=Candidatus Amarobacter glycogenicus TaxID=3140699 RepID=UPI003134F911|nr:hypothetical protein [Dehalococcoidia bacterium]